MAALRLAREGSGNAYECTRNLALAKQFLITSVEVLSMRAQYFCDITENGIQEARQMAFLVKQGSASIHSNRNRTARESLTGNLEIEAAKQLERARLERANKIKDKNGCAGSAAESR